MCGGGVFADCGIIVIFAEYKHAESMRTISINEFAARPDHYLDLAREQDVCIRRGKQTFSLAPDDDDERNHPRELPLGSDEEEIARSISLDELLKGIDEDLDRKWAERKKG